VAQQDGGTADMIGLRMRQDLKVYAVDAPVAQERGDHAPPLVVAILQNAAGIYHDHFMRRRLDDHTGNSLWRGAH